MELKEKEEYSKIQITQAEYQLQHEEKWLCELKKELDYCTKTERHEIVLLQKKSAEIKNSIPDFDEATYNRYKEFFQIQQLLNTRIKDAEIREKKLQEEIEKRYTQIDILKENICNWKAMLNKIDIPTD